jgi:hypothetical protein
MSTRDTGRTIANALVQLGLTNAERASVAPFWASPGGAPSGTAPQVSAATALLDRLARSNPAGAAAVRPLLANPAVTATLAAAATRHGIA